MAEGAGERGELVVDLTRVYPVYPAAKPPGGADHDTGEIQPLPGSTAMDPGFATLRGSPSLLEGHKAR